MRHGDADERARWQGWQQAHQNALEALQSAADDYHRLVMSQAFGADDGGGRVGRQEALSRLEALRARLDELREQQPPWPH